MSADHRIAREAAAEFARSHGALPPEAPRALPPAAHDAVWPARLPRRLTLPETSLWANLEIAARRWPDKPAYLFFGRPFTYRELKVQAERLAGWLQSIGIRRGDRIGVYLPNCPQFAIAVHAAFRADAIAVPLNPMLKADEVAHILGDSGCKVVIATPDLAGIAVQAHAMQASTRRPSHLVVAPLADALPQHIDPAEAPGDAVLGWLKLDALPPAPEGLTVLRWQEAQSAGHEPGPHLAGPDDLCLLPYTSGTTGHPKGCMHSHRTLMANVVGGALWGQSNTDSVSLAVVPMFHITGFVYYVLSPAWTGGTCVLLPRWDRELAGRLFARHRVTHWVCIPTMVIDLMASPNFAGFDLSSLKYLSGGGAAMPHAVAERLLKENGIAFAEGYGLTETAAPSHANPPERPKLQCLGMPIFGVDARVIDPATLEDLPVGEVGEIAIHGPMVFRGYWDQPQATSAAFFERDGRRYFRSGDLGRMDEEGYFFITDRLKRMINASGFKVWPSEVELMLFKCPGVQEACVIATKDDYRGESVKAVIVLKPDAIGKTTAEDVIAWSREHMAAYKVPRSVEFVEHLPKSGSGKVMWRLLQEKEMGAS